MFSMNLTDHSRRTQAGLRELYERLSYELDRLFNVGVRCVTTDTESN
jgi:hypothetical protein